MCLGETADAPHRHAVPQPRQHGCRGIDPRQSDRRRRAARRLRQDHAGADDGRGELRPADASSSPAARCSTASSAAHDIGSGTDVWSMSEDVRAGNDDARRFHGGRGLHVALGRALHDHGHGLDHGEHGRGARHGAADQRGHPGGRFAPLCAGAHGRPAHRRDGARGSPHVEDPDARGLRERHPRQRRDRRLDQRGDASAGDRRPHRRASSSSTIGTGSATTCRCWSI